MRKNLIVLVIVLFVSAFVMPELKAQDYFFYNDTKQRTGESAMGNGLFFEGFYGGIGEGFGQQNGLYFEGFTGNSNNDVCVGNGVLMMAATGFFYLINKKRKGNK